MKKYIRTILLAVLGATFSAVSVAQQDNPTYHIAATYSLPGIEKWDYLALDTQRHHLFVSRTHHVQVIDTQTGAMVGDIPNTQGVHGIAIDQEDGLGFTSNGKAQNVTVFQLNDLKTIATVQVTGADPDAILYVPEFKEVYTFNGDGHNITVIDATNHMVKKTIQIGATPEFGVNDHQGHVYFNIEDQHQIGMIDIATATILHRWNLPNCIGPTGLALDEQSHRLFSSCQNHRLVVTNAITGEHIAALPIGEHPDGVMFDAHTQQILVSNADGTLDIIRQDSHHWYHVEQNLVTSKRAKTMIYDTQSQQVYLLGENNMNTPTHHPPATPNNTKSVQLLILAPNN